MFLEWFPSQVELEDIFDYIKHDLRDHRIYLSDTDIKEAWYDLVHVLSSRDTYDYGGNSEARFIKMMKSYLSQDLDSRRGQGLHRSRSRFLTLCLVACRTRSGLLAKALLQFINKEGDDIVNEEELFLLTEWCLGLQKLEGLVSNDKLHRVMCQITRLGPPMFEEWRKPGPYHPWIMEVVRFLHELQRKLHHDHIHERDQLQLYAPSDWPLRRSSTPSRFRGGGPMLQIDMPTFPRTGYNTPRLSPRIYPTAGEVNAIQRQQREQAYELEQLRQDVENFYDWF